MKFRKPCAFILSLLISGIFCLTAAAGSYTVTQYISGSFGTPNVTVTNSSGAQHTGGAFWLSSTVTNVTSITQSVRLDSVTSGSALSMNVFYSTDGVNFYNAMSVFCPLNLQISFTINFGTPQTVKALFYLPDTATWPGYSYTVWMPSFTRTLIDNTTPSIALSQQSYYSKSYVTVTANVSDSESGIAVKKWAQGLQSFSYFNTSGNSFTGNYFNATANGYYTVYARDFAGNETMKNIYVSMLDNTAPTVSATASTTHGLTNTVTVSVSDGQSGVAATKWAYGQYTTSYFASGGTAFTGSTFTVTQNGYVTIYAKDALGNEAVFYLLITNIDDVITVVHPAAISYTLNPNSSSPFSMSDIAFTNNSRFNVKVSVQSFSAISGGGITMTDVTPDYFTDWSHLTAAQTKKYIALGVQAFEVPSNATGWNTISNSSPIYGAQISSPVLLGVLNPNGATGYLRFNAKYGLAWDDSYTTIHSLILLFQKA